MGGTNLESCALCEAGRVNPNVAQQTCALCDFGMISQAGFSGWACLAAETAPGMDNKNTYMDPGRIFGQKLGPENTIAFTVSGSNDAYIALHSSMCVHLLAYADRQACSPTTRARPLNVSLSLRCLFFPTRPRSIRVSATHSTYHI